MHSVFAKFCPALGLKVETAIGQHSFAAEQAKFVAPASVEHPTYASASALLMRRAAPRRAGLW